MEPKISYEVHWARSNRADKVVAFRSGATNHLRREDAEVESKGITSSRPDLVPLVVEVRAFRRR